MKRSQFQEFVQGLVREVLNELDQSPPMGAGIGVAPGVGSAPLPTPQEQSRNRHEANKLRIKQMKQLESEKKQADAQAKADKESAKEWDRRGSKQTDLKIKALKQPIK